ncbi:glutamine synthetase family protein [Microbulbifer bruguierae]|uniref:Glutamine synthetase family protein n=1 Tax=Microbulbifer bruguierae TaxID=3029061 RepID=A0ABY8NJK5_9GAMM|nr:glutamine synthetase family protein [Microbulbifer bruguierae]WGL17897.1 glutamine synthetase family protein [Microbulbifer bruguierae]
MSQSDNRTWLETLPTAFKTYLAGRRLDEVECIVPDLNGMSRGKAMPLSKFSPGSPIYLPVSIFYQTISGQDVEMEIANQWAESDMLLVPDMSTAMAVPWAKQAALQIIHDLNDLDGNPIPCAPRNVLKRVIGLYRDKGWRPVVAPELEFYLTQPNVDPNEPVQPPVGRNGRSGTALQSYSMSAIDEYGPVIDTIYDYAEAAGLHIDSVVQEDGAGQVEFNLTHGDPLLLADQVFYFKRIIKEAALNNGMFATFMAKPMRDQPGSAMHVHQSVVDINTGKNIFSDADGNATALFRHFIGGTQKYLMEVMPFIAPNVNSYRRFESEANSSAPTNLAWGYDNRSTGLRVPNSGAQDRRLENRVIGVDTNPYLSIAASLVCGYLGMLHGIEPDAPLQGELDDERESRSYIPTTFDEALRIFENAEEIHQVLGQDFCRLYADVKKEELRQFHREISPWEREHLLLSV